ASARAPWPTWPRSSSTRANRTSICSRAWTAIRLCGSARRATTKSACAPSLTSSPGMSRITWESCGRATFEKRIRPASALSKPASVPISKPGPVMTHSRKLPSEKSFYSLKDAEKGNNRVITIYPINLEGLGIRLEPLAHEHHDELATAAADGKLWELWF